MASGTDCDYPVDEFIVYSRTYAASNSENFASDAPVATYEETSDDIQGMLPYTDFLGTMFNPAPFEESYQPAGQTSYAVAEGVENPQQIIPCNKAGPNTVDNYNDNILTFEDLGEYSTLFSDAMANENKRRILRVVCDKVLYYRPKDGARVFPPPLFYEILLKNDPDHEISTPIAVAFAGWFGRMSPSQADQRIAQIMEVKKAVFSQGLSGSGATEPPKKNQVAEIMKGQLVQLPDASAERPFNNPEDLEPVKKKQKLRKTSKPSRTVSHQDQLLKSELEKPLTSEYQGLIKTADEAVALSNAYEGHLRRDVPIGAQDPTWPTTDEKRKAYVKELCEAIMDTTQFQEKDEAIQKLGKIEAKKLANTEGAKGQPKQPPKRKRDEEKPRKYDGLNGTDSVYVNPESTPADMKLLHSAERCQKGWEMRLQWSGSGCPPWEHFETFADRWAQVCYNARHHKVTIHSALRGDWVNRLAAGPVGERKLKIGNKALNCTRDVHNKLGREVMKKKKESAEGVIVQDEADDE
ncbi:hypothetical protein CMUS01_12764 [Colletotrichum musicola]|uniref:Uncharacterized protein n=1 Tax=Colletotrichum musicola TaxID=2175873 RepID=A0A8H6JJG5_9PEZI|nr:hypothetical protein CMUS01_12764 [Colletotrichum musicola]